LIIRLARTFGVSVEKLLRVEIAAPAPAGKPKRLERSGKTKPLARAKGDQRTRIVPGGRTVCGTVRDFRHTRLSCLEAVDQFSKKL